MIEQALKYEADGIGVIPVTPGNKHPPLVEWKRYQTERPSRSQVTEWWTTMPNANIAMLTGKISDLSVIDLDGDEGRKSFFEYLQGHLPGTRVHATPHGRHILLTYTPALQTTAGILPGVDIRSEGGYVIAPPSIVAGTPYTVFRDRPIATLGTLPPALNGERPKFPTPDAPDESGSWVSDAITNGAPLSQRNHVAARLVGYFHSRDIPRDIIEAVMGDFAARCQPPMDPAELRSTIDSVTRYEKPDGKSWNPNLGVDV